VCGIELSVRHGSPTKGNTMNEHSNLPAAKTPEEVALELLPQTFDTLQKSCIYLRLIKLALETTLQNIDEEDHSSKMDQLSVLAYLHEVEGWMDAHIATILVESGGIDLGQYDTPQIKTPPTIH
jgi:hypothetical protein